MQRSPVSRSNNHRSDHEHHVNFTAGPGYFGVSCLTCRRGRPFRNVYVIGDSLSDQGNLFLATQLVTGAGIPAADHYAMGRFSNGENYAGVLAGKLGVSLTATRARRHQFRIRWRQNEL